MGEESKWEPPRSVVTHTVAVVLTALLSIGGYKLVSPASDLVSALETQVALLAQTVSMLKETVERLRDENSEYATEDWVLQEIGRERDREDR